MSTRNGAQRRHWATAQTGPKYGRIPCPWGGMPQTTTGLRKMLEALVSVIEQKSPSMRCSILLLDDDRVTLRHGAAPRLPQSYCDAIDGLRIGPNVGSCGTAAFHRRTTIVSDIATDELWKDFRALALPIGLRACWSTPIIASDGACLGTFAMYYDEPRTPTPAELDLIKTAGELAAAVIEREGLLTASEAARVELEHRKELLEQQHVELETANANLQESTVELEMLNEQLQENATELELQADALESARAEAETANRAKTEFLATMSHELRTPLNAIGGYADLLLEGVRGVLSPEQRGDVERIKRSGQHLLGLINDILNFVKLEAGRVEFRITDTPVTRLLESLEDLVRPQIDRKSLSFLQSAPDESVLIRADEEKVRQILLNLVTNAVKFTDSGGLVAVECDADATSVRIAVRDTGRGIPPQHLERIFDPFVQIDREQTPRSQQGVGLGLSISRELAKGMGGSLTVVSALGEGTTFTVTLPRAGVAQTTNSKRAEPSIGPTPLLPMSTILPEVLHPQSQGT